VDGFARYSVILRRPGFVAVLGTSVVGRLHESMISFGVIMLVTNQGSYAQAGVVMAAYGVGGIVAGPVNSRLADRFGHVRVLLITAVAYAAAVLVMGAIVADLVALGVAALLAGLCTPPLTPAVRSVLPRLVPTEHRLTAFALESTLQEVIFVAGPVLAGGVAALAGARSALVAAAAATVLGVGSYCLALPPQERRIARPVRDSPVAERADPLLSAALLRLLAGGVGLLLLLSIATVAVIAQVSGAQARGEAGVFLALTSAGSMLGGLVFGARVRPDSPLPLRYLVLGSALVALAGVSGTIGGNDRGVLLLAAAVFVFGATIAPVGAVLFGRLSEEAGEARATEAFGWMGAAMGIGGVLGDASGGWLVTTLPPWVVMAVAGGIACATAAVVPGRMRTGSASADRVGTGASQVLR
jgi:MFS family permease